MSIIVIILVGAGSFYGGMIYAKSQSAKGFNPQSFRAGQIGDRNGNSTSGFVTGDIIAKDNNSITVKSGNSGSKIILYSDTTKIDKYNSGAISDLQVGKSISVQGATNSDGSITAQSIQIR